MYSPTRPDRSVSMNFLVGSNPNSFKSSPKSRATVVLPVPGLPKNAMCILWTSALRPRFWRRRLTTRKSSRFRKSVFTASIPIKFSNFDSKAIVAALSVSIRSPSCSRRANRIPSMRSISSFVTSSSIEAAHSATSTKAMETWVAYLLAD